MDLDQLRSSLVALGLKDAPLDVAAARARSAERAAVALIPAGWRSDAIDLGRPAEVVTGPGAKPGRTILYLHGGGYCAGSIASHRGLAGALAKAAAAEAIVLDYRLAPEHPFPAASDDSLEAYRRLLQTRPPESIVIMGDSAGGGLAVGVAVRAREAGLAMPLAIVALSPWADLTHSGGSYATKAERDPTLSKQALEDRAALYLAGGDPRHPHASPVFADLSGLPPVLLQVGGDEVLVSDSESLIAAARRVGVDATVEIWPGLFHVWHGHYPALEEAREAIGEVGAWLKRRWKS